MSVTGKYLDLEKRKTYLREYQKRYMKDYRKKLKELGIKKNWNGPRYVQSLRKKVMCLLGGEICSNCACDIYEILEINHKNGGGHKEHSKKSMSMIYHDILSGRVNKEDYNVLCRVCNALHYVTDILKIKGHVILWQKASVAQ